MAIRKVLHVIPSVGALRGGPSMMIRNLARNLASAGVETHVAATDDNGIDRMNVPTGVAIASEGVIDWYFPRQARFYTFSWPLSQWLSKHVADYDAVHIHALFSFATLPASYYAAKQGIPYVIRPLGTLNEWGMTNRRPWLKKLSFQLIESRILRHAAAVHFTSDQERIEAEKLQVVRNAKVIPNALTDIPAAADPGLFRSKYPQLEGRRVLMFLSRLDRKKGLDLLLNAFAILKKEIPDLALVIAGNGESEYRSELQRQAKELGIQESIVWPGFLSGDLKWSAFAGAELFVLPSYSENFGNAVVEAMAAGLAVVVSDQVAIHPEIAKSAAGDVVPCDPHRVAASILRLLRDPASRQVMATNGRQLVAREYSQAAVIQKIIAMYNEILQ